MDPITSPPAPMQKSNGDASSISNPLLISTLGIVGTSLAIVLYHMFLVRYCARRHASAARPATDAGVGAEILKSIPILAFSVVRSGGGGADLDECVVCLGELEEEDEVRLLPDCEHAFHVTCIDQWLAAHASCPLCRSPIVLERATADPSVEIDGVGGGGGEAAPLSPREQSIGSLRHCASPKQLKRSLSMDQYLGTIALESNECSSPSSSPRYNLSHCDRVSSKLRRSFSLLHVGRATRRPILPY